MGLSAGRPTVLCLNHTQTEFVSWKDMRVTLVLQNNGINQLWRSVVLGQTLKSS